MKKSINPGLGAAPILAFFAVAAIYMSSCSNATSTTSSADGNSLGNVILADSSNPGGSGPGGGPKLSLVISCLDKNCPALGQSSLTAGTGADSGAYVLQAQTTDAIPAKTNLKMVIRFTQNSSVSMRVDALHK